MFVTLTEDWALWRSVALRGAGLPFALLEPLGDPDLAELAADSSREAFLAAWPQACQRLSAALYDAARHPQVREAVAWQNRQALRTGFDTLLRHGIQPATRNKDHRKHEALVASYLQRYCAKNDTIGFFGPIGWACFAAESGLRQQPGPLAARTVYFEAWAATALLHPHTEALRPDIAPRLMPYLTVEGNQLKVPLAGAITLSPWEAGILRACDGTRTARKIAADIGTDDVYPVLEELARQRRIAWQLEVSPDDLHPERTLRERLRVAAPSPALTEALAALDEFEAARDRLAAAAGDADAVAQRMEELEDVFTRHAGAPATRRAGQLYAGRTVAYEECLRGGSVEFGEPMLDGIRDALGIVLDAAHWFTGVAAALWHRRFLEVFHGWATETVPLAEFWLLVADMLVDPPPDLLTPLETALHQRWARVLQLPSGVDDVRLAGAELKDRARLEFAIARPGWRTAAQHSPDLMLAGDHWVLGELHPAVNTLRYQSWIAFHPDAAGLLAAQTADNGGGAVYPGATGEAAAISARRDNGLVGPQDFRLLFAHDTCTAAPAQALPIGACDVFARDGKLFVRRRGDRLELPLLEVLGELVAVGLLQRFRVFTGSGDRRPRVTIDRLVVSRQGWGFDAGQLSFAAIADEAQRYLAVQAWARENRLPRHVFLRTQGEAKPVYLDLTGIASIDLLARAVRRAQRHAGPQAHVSVTEMLPAPDQLWLQGPDGHPTTAELRLVAVKRNEAQARFAERG